MKDLKKSLKIYEELKDEYEKLEENRNIEISAKKEQIEEDIDEIKSEIMNNWDFKTEKDYLFLSENKAYLIGFYPNRTGGKLTIEVLEKIEDQ